MKKILISWYAYAQDFAATGEGKERKRLRKIAEDSPTFNVHQYCWEGYDEHVLLNGNTNTRDIEMYDYLRSELQKTYRQHKIIPRQIPIKDVIDPTEIVPKIQNLLSEFIDSRIDIFISPGTPAMQAAWLLVAPNFKKNVTLFQLRPRQYSQDPNKPDKLFIDLNSSIFPTNLNIAQYLVSERKQTDNIHITPAIKPVFDKALQVADTDNVTCLILGENGTGKESLAEYIHTNSNRKAGPYKAINCAAFNDELLASELFGHKKGAFTGATETKKGILDEADGGTVFLDEIGDISRKMQVSLLRVIQEKEIQPVGDTKIKKIDVRIIAATNRNLKELAKEGEFRWDLYYRLKVASLTLPTLVNRGKKEIKEWLEFFIDKHSKHFKEKGKLQIEKDALDKIMSYSYPGNIRELENLVIGLYTFYQGRVTVHDLPEELRIPTEEGSLRLADVERRHILHVFEMAGGNILQTAKILDISRNTLKTRLGEYKPGDVINVQ